MSLILILKKKLLGNKLLKAFIFVVFIIVIYYQLTSKANWLDIKTGFSQSLGELNYFWLICFVFLVPFNWLVESIKWRVVLAVEYHVDLKTSIMAITSGLSLAIITPNRIGEYGGRLVAIPSKYNWLSVVSTFVGSVSQNLVTVLFGMLGLFMLTHQFPNVIPVDLDPVFVSAFLFFIFGVYLFFNIDLLSRIGSSSGVNKYLRKIRIPLISLRALPRILIAKVLGWSVLRFMIYSVQYYFVLRLFGVELDVLLSAFAIWSVFIIQTGIPLPPFLSVLARGEIALIVWGMFGVNELTILAITFTIWLINLAAPAILGLYYIMNANILSALGYEVKS